MKSLVLLAMSIFSINSFAHENGSCSTTALRAIKSAAAINLQVAEQSNDIQRLTASYRGESTSGKGIYCTFVKDDEYCAKVSVIDGNICQLANLEISSFSF